MPHTDRDLFLKWWSDAWDQGLGAASWSKSVDGLTAEQAAWQPPDAGGRPRHSIWQVVEHVIFWRENLLGRLDGGPRPTATELANRNFPQPGQASDQAWADTRLRFQESHERVAVAVRDRFDVAAGMMELLPHDCYHMGQINYVRALLGLNPIE